MPRLFMHFIRPDVDSPARPLVSLPRVATVVGTSAGTPPVVVIRPVTASPGIATITSSGTTGTIRITPLASQSIKLASSSPIVRSAVPTSTIRPILLHPPGPKPEPSPSPDVQAPPVKQEPASSTPPVTATGSQRNVIREMQVRVPNRKDKRFSVLRFHAVDHPDLSSGIEVFMQRENNLKLFRAAHNITDAPERGAGSEFGREMKEEARLKKYGIVRENYRPDDQPWLMTVGKGKTGRRRFRGVREGSVSENVEYFVFCQCKDGNFDAYPIHAWYKMKPEINYRFLRGDEAEIEYSRLHKTMNLFNVMIKRKLADGEVEDDTAGSTNRDKELGKELRYLSVATENKLRTGKDSELGANESKANSRRSNRALKLTDLEEVQSTSDLEEEEDEMEADADPDGQIGGVSEGSRPGSSNFKSASLDSSKSSANAKSQLEKARLLKKKQRDAALVARMRRCARIRKARKRQIAGSSSEEDDPLDEARDDSEVDDREGDEVSRCFCRTLPSISLG
ncbi:unnamed protein product [Dicrocoelium dendriticum]|nr:unnamed protein product [Dicrocoelium dendriticum]